MTRAPCGSFPSCAACLSAIGIVEDTVLPQWLMLTWNFSGGIRRRFLRCSSMNLLAWWKTNRSTSDASNPAFLSKEFRSEEHTSELQSLRHLVCRLLLEKKKKNIQSAPMAAYVHCPDSRNTHQLTS